jgi:hypothetical protein
MRGINGQSAKERLRPRQEQSAPPLAALEAWLREPRARLSSASAVAGRTDQSGAACRRSDRFIEDERICLTNNAAGLGATDPLTGMIADWSGTIVTAYVGGRSIENVAGIFKR